MSRICSRCQALKKSETGEFCQKCIRQINIAKKGYGFKKKGGRMREFKFRAWDKKRKKMHPEAWPFAGNITVPGFNDLEDAVLMQSTTFRDRNNHEIYEGDLVKDPWGELYKVEWVGSGFWFVNSNKKDESIPDLGYHMEIVGNIYETKGEKLSGAQEND